MLGQVLDSPVEAGLLLCAVLFGIGLTWHNHRTKQLLRRALRDGHSGGSPLLERAAVESSRAHAYIWSGQHRKLGDPVVDQAVLKARTLFWRICFPPWLGFALLLIFGRWL